VASTVLHESERLDALVADLLALAKADETNGASPVARGPVDLDEVVLEDVARLRSLGHDVGAEGVSAARVVGDLGQLQHLVRNLLDNASRHASATVTVSLREATIDGAGVAVLDVDDDGPGIPVADRERVFERFARLDEGRTRVQGGAGLGLSLVKAIATSHGGTVVAAEAPSGGARFEVRLPLADAGLGAEAEVRVQSPRPG
jgi:signal transduction histidine kinase